MKLWVEAVLSFKKKKKKKNGQYILYSLVFTLYNKSFFKFIYLLLNQKLVFTNFKSWLSYQ